MDTLGVISGANNQMDHTVPRCNDIALKGVMGAVAVQPSPYQKHRNSPFFNDINIEYL